MENKIHVWNHQPNNNLGPTKIEVHATSPREWGATKINSKVPHLCVILPLETMQPLTVVDPRMPGCVQDLQFAKLEGSCVLPTYAYAPNDPPWRRFMGPAGFYTRPHPKEASCWLPDQQYHHKMLDPRVKTYTTIIHWGGWTVHLPAILGFSYFVPGVSPCFTQFTKAAQKSRSSPFMALRQLMSVNLFFAKLRVSWAPG